MMDFTYQLRTLLDLQIHTNTSTSPVPDTYLKKTEGSDSPWRIFGPSEGENVSIGEPVRKMAQEMSQIPGPFSPLGL